MLPERPALDHLASVHTAAVAALLAELRAAYPLGAQIQVRCQSNHPKPLPATVIDYHPGNRAGWLRVELRGGHQTSVPYTAVEA